MIWRVNLKRDVVEACAAIAAAGGLMIKVGNGEKESHINDKNQARRKREG